MKILVEAINTPNIWKLGGTTAKLRIYANQPFQTSLGQWWPQGTPGAQNTFYLEIICTVLAGELTIPSFELDSTVDAIVNPHTTYTAELVSSNNKRVPFLTNFAVNTLEDGDPSTTWGEIVIQRDRFNPQSIPASLSRQLDSQIQLAVGQLNRASATNTGVVAITEDPLDPIFPIAVGANDPFWLALQSGEGIAVVGIDVSTFATGGDGSVGNPWTGWDTATPWTSGDLYFRTGYFEVGANLTFPAEVRLWFAEGARLKPVDAVTVIILGSIHDTPYQIFTNILSGQGTISFAGNNLQREWRTAWWGVVGDGITDCTPILQRITNQFNADNLGATLILPSGTILLSGALQDTGLSNAQWVLPKRTVLDGQLSLKIIGERVPAMLAGTAGESGTVLRSTLGAGTGAMISSKTGDTFGSSQLNVWFEDITFEMPVNPTNTGLDMRYIKRLFMDRFKIWCGETTDFTEPTTNTSYGLRTPAVNVVSDCAIRDGVISGFYNSVEVNELAHLENIEEGPSINGYVFPQNWHPVSASRIGSFWSKHTLKFTGEATVAVDVLHIERTSEAGKWYSHDAGVTFDDLLETTAGDAHGYVNWVLVNPLPSPHFGDTEFVVRGPAGVGKNVRLRALHTNSYVYNNVDPIGTLFLANPAVFEINAKKATSGEADFAVLNMGAEQSGTANTVAIITFVNSALGVDEKRIAQIGVGTNGALNSGLINFSTWNAGVLGIRLSITKSNVLLPGLPVHANNAAAVAAGLAVGTLYRTGGDPDAVAVVH